MKTVIVDYNAGNVKSLQFALERLGVDAQITHDNETVSYTHLTLPTIYSV